MEYPQTIDGEATRVEESDFRQVANPANTLLLPEDTRTDDGTYQRGAVVKHLSRGIPLNDYGLPLYYIRSDLIDWTKLEAYGHVQQQDIDAAAELLSYEEGYPTFKTGSPFWVQMKHEPHPDYLLFQSYLDLAEDDGIRLLDRLAQLQQVSLERLRQLAYEFYWAVRAKAYDLFIVAAEAKKREVRTRKTENTHFDAAGSILNAVITRFNDDPELINKMDAAELIDTMEKMVKIQRLSLGLTGQAASSTSQLPMNPGASVELVMRTLTKNVGLSGKAEDNFHDRLKLLMSDESTALQAQELVIRATTGNIVHSNADEAPPA